MNKPPPKIFYTRQPTSSIPTIRFKNTGNVIPGSPSNVKRYLQNVKKYHHQQSPTFRTIPDDASYSQQQNLIDMLRINQQRLRQRIIQLEFQNNQYRVMAKDYQFLTQRNKQLQEQMILLLNQIQSKHVNEDSYESLQKNAGSTKQKQMNTEESSPKNESSQYPTSFKLQNYLKQQYQKNPFKNIVIQQVNKNSILDQNSFLRNDDERIKEMINEQIKFSITGLEEKFMGYIKSIQEQMVELKLKNQQIKKIKMRSSSHSSKRKSEESQRSAHFTETAQIIDFFIHSEDGSEKKKIQSAILKPPSKFQPRKKSQQISQINIELQSETQSNPSFGKTNRRQLSKNPSKKSNSNHSNHSNHHTSHLYQSPRYEDFAIQQSEIAFSVNPFPDKFTYVVMSRIFENIETMRGHLTFVLAEKSKLTESSIENFQFKVYKELKNVLQTFFKERAEADKIGPTQCELMSETNNMRLKIRELTEQISILKQQIKVKVDEQITIGQVKYHSQRRIDEPGSESMRALNLGQEFIETERRLIKVIEIMKSFNQEYQGILEQSRAISMPQASITQPLSQ